MIARFSSVIRSMQRSSSWPRRRLTTACWNTRRAWVLVSPRAASTSLARRVGFTPRKAPVAPTVRSSRASISRASGLASSSTGTSCFSSGGRQCSGVVMTMFLRGVRSGRTAARLRRPRRIPRLTSQT